MIKQEFIDYRTKFRNVMNDVRAKHYDEFAKLGLEKESSRVATQGKAKSGKSVYKQIDEEVKQMKERLKAAGVNRIIAGINDEKVEEQEYDYESEDDANDATESPEKPKQEPEVAAT